MTEGSMALHPMVEARAIVAARALVAAPARVAARALVAAGALVATPASAPSRAQCGARLGPVLGDAARRRHLRALQRPDAALDRKSTRLNSSHVAISYAVFCLKKKRK